MTAPGTAGTPAGESALPVAAGSPPAGEVAAGLEAWFPGLGLVAVDDEGELLLTADSWLVAEGCVRALHRHRDRFLAACTLGLGRSGQDSSGLHDDELNAFWAEAMDRIPRTGQWFPRVELVGSVDSPRLRIRVRPCPPLDASVRVWAAPVPDPRRSPHVKGPDLGRLNDLRRVLAPHGADETLLTTESGLVIEAAVSSVCWWDGDRLYAPDPRLRSFPGITLGLVVERAREMGIEVRHVRRRVEDLAGHEAWLLNALYGIRSVTEWLGTSVRPGPAPRAASWQTWLASLPEPF